MAKGIPGHCSAVPLICLLHQGWEIQHSLSNLWEVPETAWNISSNVRTIFLAAILEKSNCQSVYLFNSTNVGWRTRSDAVSQVLSCSLVYSYLKSWRPVISHDGQTYLTSTSLLPPPQTHWDITSMWQWKSFVSYCPVFTIITHWYPIQSLLSQSFASVMRRAS